MTCSLIGRNCRLNASRCDSDFAAAVISLQLFVGESAARRLNFEDDMQANVRGFQYEVDVRQGSNLTSATAAAAGDAGHKTSLAGWCELMQKPEPLSIDIARSAVIVVDLPNDFGSRGEMLQHYPLRVSARARRKPDPARRKTVVPKAGTLLVFKLRKG